MSKMDEPDTAPPFSKPTKAALLKLHPHHGETLFELAHALGELSAVADALDDGMPTKFVMKYIRRVEKRINATCERLTAEDLAAQREKEQA